MPSGQPHRLDQTGTEQRLERADRNATNLPGAGVRVGAHSRPSPSRIEFDPIAHRFAARNRIRLVVAGGSHPRWERNLGTSDDPAISSRIAPSTRTLDLAGSTLVLPVGS